MREIQERPGDSRIVPRLVVPGLGEVGRNPEHALRGEVERRREDLPHADPRRRPVEAQPLLEERELASRGERRARQHHRLDAVEQGFLEQRGEVERHRRRQDIRLTSTAALEPAHRRSATRRGTERGGEALGRRREAPHHAPQLAQELRLALGGIVERQPVGDGLDAVPQPIEGHEQVVERDPKPFGPHRIFGERLGEPQRRL